MDIRGENSPAMPGQSFYYILLAREKASAILLIFIVLNT